MTRAVIELSQDISDLMPRLNQQIKGCAYNEKANLLAFRFKEMAVTMEPRRINIFHIEDEILIKTFIDWFASQVDCIDNNIKKQ